MAESFEEALEIADVYAAALFDLARQAGCVPEVRGELEGLVRLEKTEPAFASFMRSYAVDDDKRQASLETMFRGKLSDIVLNTLQVMNEHGRAGLLPALLRCYVLWKEHAAGQSEGTATSAVMLDDVHKKALESWAATISGRKPLVEYVVDPEVIGGLVVQIGGYRFDHSVRRHLQGARAKLLQRSSHGLDIGVEG